MCIHLMLRGRPFDCGCVRCHWWRWASQRDCEGLCHISRGRVAVALQKVRVVRETVHSEELCISASDCGYHSVC